MKKMILALFTISAMFVLSSCGSDDPEKIQKTFKGVGTQTIVLESAAGSTTTPPANKIKLDELFKGSADYGAPIVGWNYNLRECEMNIVGLPEGTSLENFKLTINDKPWLFKETITTKNVSLDSQGNEVYKYFQEVLADIAHKKHIETTVTFTPTQSTIGKNVKLEIKLAGTCTYEVEVK
ncbi:hypothetical protein [Dysgonomonas sp. Marseille-P4361]|uniref:hypothetical protein n=1 Tax=Dysgonomonas sp. Marseille-P4361 TaxID=2161820 RepID=UPI000D560709|nr:hypothetical protein [Dysgonomonas sp. Marseille-P4361]